MVFPNHTPARIDPAGTACRVRRGTGSAAGPELTIVVPTLNESGNIRPLLARLDVALPDLG